MQRHVCQVVFIVIVVALDGAHAMLTEPAAPINSAIGRRLYAFLKQHQCRDVYLDMGSNIGVQPRKLFEPECYPGASALAKFTSYFGEPNTERRRRVCVIGFEPNKHHSDRLSAVERHLRRKTRASIIFFKETGIGGHRGSRDSNLTFYTDGAMTHNEWGGHLETTSNSGQALATVRVASLGVVLWAIGEYGFIDTLYMKSDIEGSEYEAFARATTMGVWCRAAKRLGIVMELHGDHKFPDGRGFISAMLLWAQIDGNCKIELDLSDDESFLHDVQKSGNQTFDDVCML
jgi:hypothetical protein